MTYATQLPIPKGLNGLLFFVPARHALRGQVNGQLKHADLHCFSVTPVQPVPGCAVKRNLSTPALRTRSIPLNPFRDSLPECKATRMSTATTFQLFEQVGGPGRDGRFPAGNSLLIQKMSIAGDSNPESFRDLIKIYAWVSGLQPEKRDSGSYFLSQGVAPGYAL